ncbi:MAG: NADH-quinone oxidoreductase subunit J [Candidatus Micrarchaeia archaeon]
MLYVLLLVIAALVFAASAGVFFTKSLLRAVVLFALVATGSAILFALAGQSLAGVLQLVVFVGGISTYFVLSFSSDEKRTQEFGVGGAAARIIAIAIIGAAVAGALLLAEPGAQAPAIQNSFATYASAALSSYYPVLYLIVLLLFAVALGSVLVMRALRPRSEA